MPATHCFPDDWKEISRHCRRLPLFIAVACVSWTGALQFLSARVGMWEAWRIGQEGLHAAKRGQARAWWERLRIPHCFTGFMHAPKLERAENQLFFS